MCAALLKKYFTQQQVHKDTTNKAHYLFTIYRELCLFANYRWLYMHCGEVTLVVSMFWLLMLLLCCN